MVIDVVGWRGALGAVMHPVEGLPASWSRGYMGITALNCPLPFSYCLLTSFCLSLLLFADRSCE